jgi:glutathione S-transferase
MLELYGHPFSSYTWKAQIALYEKAIPFAFRVIEPDHPENASALKEYWPLAKFPVLVDQRHPVIESSIIIEYLDRRFPDGVRMLPQDGDAALVVRFMDRLFDNHVMSPMQAVVNEYILDAQSPDQARVERGRSALDAIYPWLDKRLARDEWACGAHFTMADCAAAPALFYADWVHPIAPAFTSLAAYRARLLARPSVARCVEDARPFRAYFPLGAPDRD